MKKVIIMILMMQSCWLFANEITIENAENARAKNQFMQMIKTLEELTKKVDPICVPKPPVGGQTGRAVEEEGTGGKPGCGGQN